MIQLINVRRLALRRFFITAPVLLKKEVFYNCILNLFYTLNEEQNELVTLLGGLEAVYDQLNDQILFNLRNKSVAQLRNELRQDPAEVLQHVYEIAFEAEQYEICEAVRQLQNDSTKPSFKKR